MRIRIAIAVLFAIAISACTQKPPAAKEAPLANAMSALTELAGESPGPSRVAVPTPSPSAHP